MSSVASVCQPQVNLTGSKQSAGHGRAVNEGFALPLNLLTRASIDHIMVVGGDLLMQTALGCMRQQIAVLVNRAAL